jgi:hypothetical protein
MITEPEALARALLASARAPRVVVWCPPNPGRKPRPARKPRPQRHRLGQVFDIPDGEPALCVPEFSILPRDLYEGRPDGSPVTFRAWAYTLTADAKDVLARCDHGTFKIDCAELLDDVARARRRGTMQHTFGSWTGPPDWLDDHRSAG